MKSNCISIVLLLLVSFPGYTQQATQKAAFSAILDTAVGKDLLQQCSRSAPAKVTGFWQVSRGDTDSLERHFSNLDTLKASGCCWFGGKVINPNNYGLQYIGVVIGKHKYIYINAFPVAIIDIMKEDQPDIDPVKKPVVICDGGPSFWGALFDIETKTFSELSFNGMA